MQDAHLEGLTYVQSEPDMLALRRAYDDDVNDSSGFFDNCADSWNQRRNLWNGKTRDQKKHALDAKPWRFASDQEVPVIDPRINTLVALMMNAVRDGNLTAQPVGSNDVERAAATSNFMRWCIDAWVVGFYDQIELTLNHMLEKGYAATFVGWESKKRQHLEQIDIEQIAETAPEVAEMLMDVDREEEVIAMLQETFEGVKKSRARKALKQLRKTGVAEIPIVVGDINRPCICAQDPASDIIIPSYTMDASKMHRAHLRHFMTAQDIENMVAADEVDKRWAKEVIENHMGVTQSELDGPYAQRGYYHYNRNSTLFDSGSKDAEDLVEVVRTFQRFIDPDDGAEGIYQTIWCPKQAKTGTDDYGSFELMNGWDEMPIAITPLTRDTKRILDVRNVSNLLKGNQRQAKVTRDSYIDQMSIAMNPPRTHPAGRPAAQWGAGADFATRRGEENLYRTLDLPDTRRDGVALEEYLDSEADRVMGLSSNDPASMTRQQYYINRALYHVSEVCRLIYKNYQKFGDDEIHFRITGVPDPQTFNKLYNDEELDVRIAYDARMSNPEFVEKAVQNLMALAQNDPDGTYNSREIRTIAAYMTVPQFAQRIVQPEGQAREQILKKVAMDISFIDSGQAVNAQPNGARVALDYLSQYVQQQDIMLKMQQDPAFAERLMNYAQGYEFQISQQQNATIGRIGASPTQLQGITNQ